MPAERRKQYDMTYERLCRPRFDDLARNQEAIEETVGKMNAVINNGLKESVMEIRRSLRWMMGILIGLIFTVVSTTIGIYTFGAVQHEMLREQMEVETKEVLQDVERMLKDREEEARRGP